VGDKAEASSDGKAGIVVEYSSTDSNLLLDDVEGDFDACGELTDDENLPMILQGPAYHLKNTNFLFSFKSKVKIPDGKEGFYDIYFLACYNGQPISFDVIKTISNV
jgi:hypothetical protein